MINLNTKGKHGETAYHCAFKEEQFDVRSADGKEKEEALLSREFSIEK